MGWFYLFFWKFFYLHLFLGIFHSLSAAMEVGGVWPSTVIDPLNFKAVNSYIEYGNFNKLYVQAWPRQILRLA